MRNTPLLNQVLPVDHLLSAQSNIKAGKPVSGEELLLVIEQSIQQQLPDDVCNIVRRAFIPAVKTPGRPSKFGAPLDLALEKVDQRYPSLLRYEKRKKDRLLQSGKAASKGESPSLLAYARLLRHMRQEFGPITREALRNMHSKWRNGDLHSAENDTDSEDFDAEIERMFPAAPES